MRVVLGAGWVVAGLMLIMSAICAAEMAIWKAFDPDRRGCGCGCVGNAMRGNNACEFH